MADATRRSYIEWQTKTLAAFFAVSAQSEKAAKAVQDAANELSITGKKSSAKAPPTLDHLPPDDGPNAERNAAQNAAKANGTTPGGAAAGQAGSFERLSGLFGGGVMRAGPQAG